jgi:hypothetical protein
VKPARFRRFFSIVLDIKNFHVVIGFPLGMRASCSHIVDFTGRGTRIEKNGILAIVCAALALAGCATRIAADDVDEAAARQAADAECRRGFEAILRGLKLVNREDAAVLMVAKLTID